MFWKICSGVGRRRSLPGGAGCCRVGGGFCIWSSGGGGSASGGLRPGVGPGRGAQRRRFGEPGLSSAASNSMGRFKVAPHAMPLTGQGPRAVAVVTAAQAPAPQRSSQAKPAPMAPPAPGSGAGPASCDVTDLATARQRERKPEEGRSGRSISTGLGRGAPCFCLWNGSNQVLSVSPSGGTSSAARACSSWNYTTDPFTARAKEDSRHTMSLGETGWVRYLCSTGNLFH